MDTGIEGGQRKTSRREVGQVPWIAKRMPLISPRTIIGLIKGSAVILLIASHLLRTQKKHIFYDCVTYLGTTGQMSGMAQLVWRHPLIYRQQNIVLLQPCMDKTSHDE